MAKKKNTPSRDTFVEITNDTVYDKLLEMEATISEILVEAKRTNGRITRLEKKSLGMWIVNNPYKFAIGFMVVMSIIISDFRHPIIDWFITLI